MKAIWFGMVALSLAATPTYADEQPWYVVVVKGEPSICGQSSEGQLLCLHPAEATGIETSTGVRPVRFEAHDWSFLGAEGTAI